MATNNISLQKEELEVLESIFQKNWKHCSVVPSRYIMKIAKDIELWIILNEFYPSNKPPGHDLWAPNLDPYHRGVIAQEFQKIYNANRGCPIIFQWIERLKELVDLQKSKKKKQKHAVKLSELTPETWDKLKLNIVHGISINDRKSTFQAHVCKVTDVLHVRQFVSELRSNTKIAGAKHNILAYRISYGQTSVLEDYDNDGEKQGANPVMQLLKVRDLTNIAVVVTRWYGGIHLGSDRFRHIRDAAQQALVAGRFIER